MNGLNLSLSRERRESAPFFGGIPMNQELSAALKAISRALDGAPDRDVIFGCQVILETLCDADKGVLEAVG